MTRINPICPTIRTKERKRDDDKKYLEFLRKQRSAFSNRWPCVAAHYRTAANSGISIKPLFSAIPLTNPEHQEQHQIGQYKFASKIWWEAQVKKYQLAYEMQGGVIPEKYRVDIKA